MTELLDISALRIKAAYSLGVYVERADLDALMEIAEAAQEWHDWHYLADGWQTEEDCRLCDALRRAKYNPEVAL